MGTSIGAAIDYLVAGLKAPAVEVDPDVEIADNLASEGTEALITIGRESFESPTASTRSQTYASLGQLKISENYTIPGFVYVERQGPDQKTARDAAIALFDVVVKFIRDDPTLGGLLHDGRIAAVTQATLVQTPAPDTGAQMTAEIDFGIEVDNTYIP